MAETVKSEKIKAELEIMPIIAAVRDIQGVQMALESDVNTVFVLGADILSIGSMIEAIRRGGRHSFVHIDLVEGLGKDEAGVKYLAHHIRPDGAISTRPHLLKRAAEEGLVTVHRMFLIDDASFHSGIRLIKTSKPDFVEVMPSLVPKAIKALVSQIPQSVIAGGMATCKEDVFAALSAGALAVSTSAPALWRDA